MRRGGRVPSHSRDWRTSCQIGDREVPGEVRGEGHEKVLLEIRCGRLGLNWCNQSFLESQIELQIERRIRFRFPENEPRQQPDTHQHTNKSRYKYQRVRRPHACHEPPAEHRCEISQ
jgi:hypothetical protein